MMDQREKLIDLIDTAFESQENDKCRVCDAYDCAKCVSEYIADHLLANGVVVLPCRCAECEYYIYPWKSNDGQVYGLCDIHGTADLKSTDFCSYAKRKGGDE